MSEIRYRADIDGLRAIAVALVVLFHAGFGFSGGFVGVDVFFVISGFLITRLILKQQHSGDFQLSRFWARRIRRIVPAATVVVVAVLVAGAFVLLPADYQRLGESAIAQQLMGSNVYFWQHTGYFDGQMDLNPLLHTWSLGVEEQFYLAYPLLLMLLRRFSKRGAMVALLGLGIFSLVVSQWGIAQHPRATFYLLPTRAWELIVGGMICFVPAPTRLRPTHRSLLSLLSMGGILFAAWFFSPNTPFPGLFALLPCGAAAILIYANAGHPTPIARFLAWRPIVFVGLISYSLYLWHWPLLTLLRYSQGNEVGVLPRGLALAASFGLAYLSWRFIEKPFRSARADSPISWPYVASVSAAVGVVALSATVVLSHGWRARFSEKVLAVIDGIEVPVEYQTSLREASCGHFPRIGIDAPHSDHVDFILWGDSHAMSLIPLANELACKYKLTGEIAVYAGVVPLVDVWRPAEGTLGESKRLWNQYVFDHICEKRVPDVILAARWAVNILGRPTGKMDSLIIDNESRDINPEESREAFTRSLCKTVGALEQLGIDVQILGQNPLQKGNPPKQLFYAAWHSVEVPKGVSYEEHMKRQIARLQAFGSLPARHTYLDPIPYLFDENGISRIGDGAKSFYCDDDHLSPYGAKVLLTKLIEPVFAKMAAEKEFRKNKNRSIALGRSDTP